MSTSIGMFSLKNSGGFVVKQGFEYLNGTKWVKKIATEGYPVAQTKSVDPGQFGCPNGSTVRIYADVVAGNDKEGSEQFIYETGNVAIATYEISGTTLNDKLKFLGILVNQD